MAEEKMYVSPFETVRLTSEDVNVGNYLVYAAYDEDEAEHILFIDEECTKPATIADIVHAAKRGTILVHTDEGWKNPIGLTLENEYENIISSEWIGMLVIGCSTQLELGNDAFVTVTIPVLCYGYNPNYDPDAVEEES